MQIEIYNPKTESDYIQSIDWNHEQLKKEITQALEKYQGRVYTDETIKEAKADRANLNKFTEALENKRKEIKKLCLKPYEDFETQVKELVSLVDAPKLAIDTQVKTFEQKKQGEKKAQIEAFYAENVGDLASLIPLDKIFKKEWLNVTVSMKKVETEISEILNKVQFDLATIKDLKSEFELNMQDTYLQTFDISAALREKTRLEERKAALEAREAEEKAKQQVIPTVLTQAVEPVQEVSEQSSSVAVMEKPEEEAEPLKTYKFQIECTKEQAFALAAYMKAQGIKYQSIN